MQTLAVNPGAFAAQVESAIVWGLSPVPNPA